MSEMAADPEEPMRASKPYEAAHASSPEFGDEANSNSPIRGEDADGDMESPNAPNDGISTRGWKGVAAAAGIGAFLVTVAAREMHAHHRDVPTVQPNAEIVSPEIVHAVARIDAFLKGDGDVKAARRVDRAQLRRWATRLQREWNALSEEARSQLREMPSTWDRVQQLWPTLSKDDRRVVRENWLPAQLAASERR